ncbi:MAG: hypothetical protein FJY48_11710 [Betaproteobacteria bacterium]|nr:hypothetical protein [Betaproteobacteria bacterium]
MIAIHYHSEKLIQRTASGAACYRAKWHEAPLPQFSAALAGTQNRRGTTLVWVKPNETFADAVARRATEKC